MHKFFIAWYLFAYCAVCDAEPEIEIPVPPEGYFHVTLLVYAGLRDPVWKIGQCLNSEIPYLLLQARNSGHVYKHECIPPKTGYKGFLIHDTTGEHFIVGHETVQLQLLLLDTMPDELPPTSDHRQGIKSVITSGKVSADCPAPAGRFAPPFNPVLWNGNRNVRRKNNCYNYANARITNTFAQPGRGGNKKFAEIAADAIKNAAQCDDLVVLDPQPAANDPVPQAPGGNSHLVALFIAPGGCHDDGDFHWYRLDNNGRWSHKPGETDATDLDDAGRPIADPRKANTGRYKFICFMTTDAGVVKIR